MTKRPNPGRPPIGPVIRFRLPPDTLAALDTAAANAGKKRAEWIRDLITHHLAKEKQP